MFDFPYHFVYHLSYNKKDGESIIPKDVGEKNHAEEKVTGEEENNSEEVHDREEKEHREENNSEKIYPKKRQTIEKIKIYLKDRW